MLLSAIIFAACSGGSSSSRKKDTSAATMPATDTTGKLMASVKYTCTMHSENYQ